MTGWVLMHLQYYLILLMLCKFSYPLRCQPILIQGHVETGGRDLFGASASLASQVCCFRAVVAKQGIRIRWELRYASEAVVVEWSSNLCFMLMPAHI